MLLKALTLGCAMAVGCSGIAQAVQAGSPEVAGGASQLPAAGRGQMIHALDGIAQSEIDQRDKAIALIRTQAEAERRKTTVRKKVLDLIGGLPDVRGPLSVRQFGVLHEDGFRIERIVYDSLPGFHVTADLYVPTNGSGPFPAVIYTPGHGSAGKVEAYGLAGNLARNGIAVLAYDVMGQGQRLQYFDPATGASKVGHPTGEHGEASVQTMILGEHISRYFVWDAMRGIDYLSGRDDIDPQRIGAFGCSGGGTVTAYLAALDDRVKAAAVACYITSFQALLSTIGPQDAEQSIPNFLQEGLGFADWIELAAPRPYAIVSTTEDMFPFAGARQSHDEAARIYGLYGEEERLRWFTGPGTHGQIRGLYPQIVGFFARWLAKSDHPPVLADLQPPPMKDLLCTPTGQVSTSLGGETIYTLNRKRAEVLLPAKRPVTDLAGLHRLQAGLRQAILAIAGIKLPPAPATVTVSATEKRPSYRLETLLFRGPSGLNLPGVLAVPNRSGRKAAVLMLESQSPETVAAPGSELDRQASSGHVVLLLPPAPWPPGSEGLKSPVLGSFYLLSLRAMLVGRTMVGLRTEDMLAAMQWLREQPDVDRSLISAYADGPSGVVLLHAAVLDPGIRQITIEHALSSYRSIVEEAMPRNVSENMISGVLRHYDLDSLILAIAPRPVTIVNPVDAEGNAVEEHALHRQFAWIFQSDLRLGNGVRVRIVSQRADGEMGLQAEAASGQSRK